MRLLFLSARQRRIKSRQDALAAEMRVLIRTNKMHVYEVRPRKDRCGADLISDVLPFGRVWYGNPTRSATQSDARNSIAGHMTLRFAFTMQRAT